jgi:hypothetical protein
MLRESTAGAPAILALAQDWPFGVFYVEDSIKTA